MILSKFILNLDVNLVVNLIFMLIRQYVWKTLVVWWAMSGKKWVGLVKIYLFTIDSIYFSDQAISFLFAISEKKILSLDI